MPSTSVAQANSKTAEFARLFDLFDRVASRRTRRALAGGASEVISADDIAGVPAEFAPVVQNLSTILNLRALRDEEYARRVQTASTTQGHRNTLVIAPPAAETPCPVPVSMDQEDHDMPTFPLGERYPFTFKLMLHKLYDLDEWAEKVKHAVETSKSQFKPLAERVQNVVKDATANIKRRGDEKKENNGPRGASAKLKQLNTVRYVRAAALPSPSAKTETSRVVKKRCIGRRKSVSGPMSTGVWVYDAAVSATEVTVPRSAGWAETFYAPRRPSGMTQNRARHQSLPAFKLEEMQPRDSTRRKVKNTSPQLRPDVFESVTPEPFSTSLSQSAQEMIEMENAKRRARGRSVAYSFTSESGQGVTAKRPLCI